MPNRALADNGLLLDLATEVRLANIVFEAFTRRWVAMTNVGPTAKLVRLAIGLRLVVAARVAAIAARTERTAVDARAKLVGTGARSSA